MIPVGTRVRITRYGSGYGYDAEYHGREGVVAPTQGYSHYVSVNLDGARSGSIDTALPCMTKELEILP